MYIKLAYIFPIMGLRFFFVYHGMEIPKRSFFSFISEGIDKNFSFLNLEIWYDRCIRF